jgi:hypothetical protein
MTYETIWKDVPGHPDLQASNFGMIRKRLEDGSFKCIAQKFYAYSKNKSYWTVCVNGSSHLVHRLVCLAFHGLPTSKGRDRVGHWDDDPNNNRSQNLRWVTHAENLEDHVRNGGRLGAETARNPGSNNPNAKLTEADVVEIRKDPRSNSEVAVSYGVTRSTVWYIRSRKAWAHVA